MSEELLKAMEELKRAKEELEKIRKSHEKAKKEVENEKKQVSKKDEQQHASLSLPSSVSFTHAENIPNYSDKSYWETRYADDNQSGNGEKDDHFDWYLDFDSYKKILSKEMAATRRTPSQKLRVMVPGCGDSLLCEDILSAEQNISEIVGIDFSESLVKKMNNRAKANGLKNLMYRAGDLTNLKLEADNSFDFIVDKATLDAIATVNATSESPHVDNIMKYIFEMWRVMSMHGRLVLITTMPPNIFEELVGNFLYTFLVETGINVKHPISNWQHGHGFQEVKGRNGMSLFLYSLVKIRDRDTQQTLVKKSIAQMVEAAKEELLDQKLMGENPEEAEMKEIDASLKLESKQQQSLDVPAEVVFHPFNKSSTESHLYQQLENAIHSTRGNSKVFLEIIPSNHQSYYAKQSLTVRYWIQGDWNEDDALRLVLDTTATAFDTTASPNACLMDHAMYSKQENCFEIFEYSAAPQPVSIAQVHALAQDPRWVDPNNNADFMRWYEAVTTAVQEVTILVGEVSLTLPEYAGVFHCSYVRPVVVLPDETVASASPDTSERRAKTLYVSLATTASFSVKASLSPGHPDMHRTLLPASLRSAYHSRRKATVIVPSVRTCDVYVEQLHQVRKLQVLIQLSSDCPSIESAAFSVNRVLVWLENEPQDVHLAEEIVEKKTHKTYNLSMEFDYILPSSSFDANDASVSTEYVQVQVVTDFGQKEQQEKQQQTNITTTDSTRQQWQEIDWAHAECEILRNHHGDNFVSIRIPLVADPSSMAAAMATPSSLIDASCREFLFLSALEKSQTEPTAPLVDDICCKFCSQSLLVSSSSSIHSVHPLPTGIFNEMLYDFVCCEDASCMSLQCEDLSVKVNKLYCSLTSCWLHRDHVLSPHIDYANGKSPVKLVCKESQSFQDLFTVTGATVMTNKMPRLSSSKENEESNTTRWLQRMFTGMVNTDYCAIRCRRCDAWLGDGRIDMGALEEDAAAAFSEDVDESSFDPNSYEFPAASLLHVEWSWHAVSLYAHVRKQSMKLDVTILQLAGRLALYIMEKFAKPLTCFYLSNGSASGSFDRPVIVLKVLSKQSGAVSLVKHGGGQRMIAKVEAVVKATYVTGRASELLRGTEARIPLEIQDFVQLESRLKENARVWSAFHAQIGSMALSKEEICFIPV